MGTPRPNTISVGLDMYAVQPHLVEDSSTTETDEGLGSSTRRWGSGSQGSGSLYLSDSQDWALSPGCSPDEAPGQHGAISPSLADETFRYMTYLALEPSSHRLSDPQSLSDPRSLSKEVKRQLVKRDKDLEMAAHIGNSLLQRNNQLHERNEEVEEQLNLATEQVLQLQHELAQKDELLRLVAGMSDERDLSFSLPHQPLQRHQAGGASAETPADTLSQLQVMQGKLLELEEENQVLRLEASHLKTETFSYEEAHLRLVGDCVRDLREANARVGNLTDELEQKGEQVQLRQDEIAQLLSQIAELQHRVEELALEKEELRSHLQASKDAQRQLTTELNERTQRNAECLDMLQESQEEAKELRNKSSHSGGLRRHLTYGLFPMNSLAAEIEGTMRRELSMDEESGVLHHRTSQNRVFHTVRLVNAMTSPGLPIPGSGFSSLVMTAKPFQSQGEEPAVPSEHKLLAAERRRKMAALRRAADDGEEEEGNGGGGGGSRSTTVSGRSSFSNLSELSSASGVFRTFLPEKLQIVKPMEGSLTLHHWQQLAQPHLASMLDPSPGVLTRGFRPLSQDIDPTTNYRLDDPEEDDEVWGWGAPTEEEKGSIEQGKADKKDEEEEEEDEDGGIVFRVRMSSTPADRRERSPRPPGSPLTVHTDMSSPFRPLAAVGAASFASMIRADPTAAGPAAMGTTPLTPAPVTPAPVTPTPVTPALLTPAPLTPATVTPVTPGLVQSDDNHRERSPRPPGSPLTVHTDVCSPFRPLAAVGAASFASMIRADPTAPGPVQSEAEVVASLAAPAALTSVMSSCAVQHPGKCQSHTFSTTTITTCRILHPNDHVQVTSSSQSMCSVSAPHIPSSMRTGPSTPVTPCRLNLGGGAHCFPHPRLATLVLEQGISACRRPAPRTPPPRTPPNSPVSSRATKCRPTTDIFLASRPAERFLQDIYGLSLGRAPLHPDLPSPAAQPHRDTEAGGAVGGAERADPVSVGLAERLCRLGFGRAPQGPPDATPTFMAAGGRSLLEGLRRNQSLPVMMGGPAARAWPPAHPTSLPLPPLLWKVAKGKRKGSLFSFTQPSSSPSPSSSSSPQYGSGKH